MADVIVVGAGITGCSAAINIAKAGHKVTVLEKSDYVGKDVLCGGGFTNKAVSAFPWLKEKKYLEKYDGRLIDEVEWRYGKKTLSMPDTDIMIASRNLFDKFLGEKAQGYGAEILCGKNVKRIKEEGDEVIVTANKDEKYKARIVIDASGVYGPIDGSGLGYEKQWGLGLQWELDMKESEIDILTGNKMQLIFPKWDNNLKQKSEMQELGYAWIFPRKSSIHVGAGSTSPVKTEFLRTLIQKTIKEYLLEKATKESIHIDLDYNKNERGMRIAHPRVTPPRIASNSVMIAGDAASALSPQGEGNYHGMVEGSIAGYVARKQLEEKKVCLDEYSEIMMPMHESLLESCKRTEKMLNKKIYKTILFYIVPHSRVLTKKVTDMARNPPIDTHNLELIQL